MPPDRLPSVILSIWDFCVLSLLVLAIVLFVTYFLFNLKKKYQYLKVMPFYNAGSEKMMRALSELCADHSALAMWKHSLGVF